MGRKLLITTADSQRWFVVFDATFDSCQIDATMIRLRLALEPGIASYDLPEGVTLEHL